MFASRTSLNSRALQHLLRFGAVLLLAVAMATALAQDQEQGEVIDPPARVGALSLLAGPVSLVDLSNGSREEALLNWPITAGWRLETGRGGRAEVRIGSTALRLDDDTTVDFVRLDDQFIQLAVLRGSVSLRLRSRETLTELELLTQRERIYFDDLGRYRIDVDRTASVTALSSFGGRARIVSGDNNFVVAAGQRGEVTAPPLTRFGLSAAQPDRFDDWVAERDARDDSLGSSAYVSRETTGVEQLEQYGDWRVVEDYGAVWFPRATLATWAPYRYGRWVWLYPWGWTWVDEAPWGFAPLHYGRWVVIGNSWGWVPGAVMPRPVYAPALVAWYGAPVPGRGPVGWFPLGPREPFVPAHRYSPRYLRVVNAANVPNVDRLTIVQAPKYANRHPDRSTWVAEDRFGRPEPVNRGQRPPPSEWQQYIARPQPPANVPNTKRRQGNEFAAPVAPSPMPPRPVDTRVRPPQVVTQDSPAPIESGRPPRAVEAPSVVGAPRSLTPAEGQPRDPRYSAPVDARGTRGRPDRPDDSERRATPAPQPVPAATTPQPPAQAAPQPRLDQVPAGDTLPRQPRQPGRQMPAPTFRPDDAGNQDNRRYAPRGPEVPQASRPQPPQAAPQRPQPPQAAPSRAPSPQIAPPQIAAPQVAPAQVAPPQVAPAQVAPPVAAPRPAPARPPQPPREESGGSARQGRPSYEASR